VRPVITLGKGNSTTYHPRKMKCTSGACLTNFSTDILTYNLYTSAAHSTIWGDPSVDATTSSVTMPAGCCTTNTAWSTTVFGLIPAAVSGGTNDVAVGGYTDTVVVTMTF
jgi:spore coat protein U-like protein